MRRMILMVAVSVVLVGGCTQVTYNCNVADSCPAASAGG